LTLPERQVSDLLDWPRLGNPLPLKNPDGAFYFRSRLASRPSSVFVLGKRVDLSEALMTGLNLPVLANAKTDKPDHQQDGSGHHHPIRIFHR
jgi:hypothetical protein